MRELQRRTIILPVIFVVMAVLALNPVSAGGGISAGPWRDINPTQYLNAGDTTVTGPNVPFNGIYVRAAGFGSVGAGEAWAVGGCGPSTTSPTFPFSGAEIAYPASCSTGSAGGTIAYYDGFSWTIKTDPFSGDGSFYTGVNFCTSPGSPGVGLCSPNGDGTDGWLVGGITTLPTGVTTHQVALYVSSPSVGGTPDSTGLSTTAHSYLTSVFETCHVDNDPNGKGCPSGIGGDAFAVGTDSAHGVIYEYNGPAPTGGGWTLMHTSNNAPAPTTPATIYNSVYMFIDSAGTLEGFAVGDNGVVSRLFGGSWTDTTVAPTTTTFNGIAVDNANPIDAWAVGYDSAAKGGVIYHFSSGSWAGPLSPSPVNNVVLESVDVLSTSEAWVVGTESTILHGTNLPGSNFQSISTAGSNVLDSGTGIGIDLNSVNFQSSGNGWAVGTHGVILQTSDSSCGSIVQTSSPSACWGGQTSIEQTTQFNAVYENSPSDAWAGGIYDSVNSFPSLIHWDGNKWHRATVVPGLGGVTKPDIYGIYMAGSGEGYAVGSQLVSTTAPSGGATCSTTVTICPAAFTYNVITPNTWQAVSVAQCSNSAGCGMRSVYFASIGPVDGWAVGTNGAFWTYTKSSPGWSLYSTTTITPVEDLNAVFINNPGNNNPAGWAVGNDGTVAELNCAGAPCVWTQTSIPGLASTVNLDGIYFTDSNHGWIVGSGNTIITTTNNGLNWVVGSASNAPAAAEWTSVHVDTYGTTAGSGDGWAVGCSVVLTAATTTTPRTCSGNEVTAWWDGAGWTSMNLPTPVASGLGLFSVFTTNPTDGWAVGAQPTTTGACSATVTTPCPLTGIFHLDPVVPPTYNAAGNSTSTSSITPSATVSLSATSSVSSAATTLSTTALPYVSATTINPMTTTVVSTSVSTVTVASTPTTYTTSSIAAVSTPMALPAVPGFPWESIIAGLMFGLIAIALLRRVKK